MISILNEWGKTWTTYMGLSVVQNTLFLGLLFLALFVIGNASAKIKYNVALIGLFKLCLPPFVPTSFLQWSGGSENITVGTITVQAIVADTAQIPVPVLNIHAISLLVWILAILVFLTIHLISTLRLHHRLGKSERIVADSTGLTSIRLYKNKWITMPLTFGLFHKRIYVPEQWDNWSSDCRQMILAHEMGHIRRKDGWTQTFQLLVQAIYFFHPLVWLLGKRLNEYREMACDDLSVTTKKGSHVEYSRYLVQIAEDLVQTSLGYSSASALIKQKNELLNRVKYQLEGTMKNLSRKKLFFVVTPLILLLIPLSLTFSKTGSNPSASAMNEMEKKGKIYGTVKDKETGKALSAANIMIIGTQLGVASDQDGNFWMINVPIGKQDVVATYIGYKSVLISNVDVEASQSTKLDFNMSASVINNPDYLEDAVSLTSLEQDSPSPPPILPDKDAIVFVPYDEAPHPIGGFAALQENLVYPEIARKAGIEGRVTIYAQINENGDVVRTKVVQSLGENNGCDEAAVAAVVKSKWEPAKQRDKKVAVWIAVPIDFRLSNDNKNSDVPPPPPPTQNVPDGVEFVPYDQAPIPIGGFPEILKNLIYPEEARKKQVEGKVIVFAQIDETGNVIQTKIGESFEPDYGCKEAAIKAVTSVKWEPAIQGDKKIAVWVAVPIDFTLQ